MAGSSSAWQPAGEDDTVAGRKSRLFRLGFIFSARLKEGGKTDFDREREEGAARLQLGRLGRFGRAEREGVLGRNQPNDLGKDLKTFSN